jgi:hypothetical protein
MQSSRADRKDWGGWDRTELEEPDAVAAAFVRALNGERSRLRYMIVPSRREAEMTIKAAIARGSTRHSRMPTIATRLITLLGDTLAK